MTFRLWRCFYLYLSYKSVSLTSYWNLAAATVRAQLTLSAHLTIFVWFLCIMICICICICVCIVFGCEFKQLLEPTGSYCACPADIIRPSHHFWLSASSCSKYEMFGSCSKYNMFSSCSKYDMFVQAMSILDHNCLISQ